MKKPSGKKIFLYAINIVVFCILVGVWLIFAAAGEFYLTTFFCLLLEFLFLFGSIMIYHMSIISGVMKKQDERTEADRKKREEAEKAARERRLGKTNKDSADDRAKE